MSKRNAVVARSVTLNLMTRREWLALAAATPLTAAATPDINVFFNDFLEKWVRADPEMATSMRLFTGDVQDRLDSQLSDISDEAAHARIARAREGLAALGKFDREKLTPAQRFSADMLDYQLHDIIAEEPYLSYRFPLNQFQGVQVRFPSLMTDLHPMRTRRDAENYLTRLQAAGPKIDQALAMMQDRAKQNIRLPRFISIETVSQMKRFTTPEPAQNILVTNFAERLKKIDALDTTQRNAMVSSAEKLVGANIYPAYRRAMDGLATANAHATDDAGLWRLPKGADAYAFALHRYTTTNLTADQIHRKGLDEVARIESEMNGLFQKLGYRDGSILARFQKLQDDNSYPDSPDARAQVLADYAKIIRENNERSLEAFDRRPKAACNVQRIPEFQEANAAANYQGPPRDGSRPGVFRVPLRGPKFPRPGMRTLAAHEAIPGHHFQIASQVEMTSLPGFRRQNPFGSMSAYTEGWGLYAERLASELGWYRDDAVSDLGRLNGELFRARRLVVDTGLHAQHWTREQSIAYGIQQSEVDRYVTMPGQACSYKIGQLKILELREESKKKMGPKFSLKAYHNIVLGEGQVPLTLLERSVREWQTS
ncbi:MAG: hypothetical protein JWO80_2504 [Bryobacterales bacterium]|nr:hypothetical protein [Bryobacterales bacterium]